MRGRSADGLDDDCRLHRPRRSGGGALLDTRVWTAEVSAETVEPPPEASWEGCAPTPEG